MKLFLVALVLLSNALEPQATETADPNLIEAIVVRNNRRVPSDTILFNIESTPGTVLDPDLIQRDIRALFSLGYFEDISVLEEPGETGKILIFQVEEKPLMRQIDYEGNESATLSDILERLRERNIDLTQETPYDPARIRRAELAILELLAENGRLNATIETETYEIPPNAIGIAFVIDEGPKIKIEEIEIEGNEVFSDGEIKGAMQLLSEVGPIASFRSKDVYHPLKMQDDLTRIMFLYRENGYVRANILDPEIEIRPHKVARTLPLIKPAFPWGIPLPFWKKDVDRHFIKIQIEENDQYRLGEVAVTGNEAFEEEAILGFLGLVEGQVFNETLLREGFENLTTLYGNFGYINFTPVPLYDFDDQNKLVNLTIDIEEDRQFFVNRINFRGNTRTRDKVIRREVMLEEGKIFSSQLWDRSLLRINQLGYFEQIQEDAAEIRPSPTEAEVDITLNVQERGNNSIGFSGGVSGVGGSFLGINYETNNFLGFGETLSVALQGGTRQSNYALSFTEPYVLDRPISAGFSVFRTATRFDQARDVFGLDPDSLPSGFGFEDRLNFEQSRKGFNVFLGRPLKIFQRVGLTFQYSDTSTNELNEATADFFDGVSQSEQESFVQSGGSFDEFRSRSLIPNWRYSTVNNPLFPSAGQSVSTTFEFTGGFLGGNVNFFRPVFEYQHYRPMNGGRNTLAFRFQGTYMQGFSGTSVPWYQRIFMGGDFDMRGFDFRSISPVAFIEREVTDPFTGNLVTVDDITFVGGDTSAVANLEYRIRLLSDSNILTLAPFLDVGNSWVTRKNQLRRRVVQADGTVKVEGVEFVPGTNSGLRASTGIELQVQMPVINAPFRLLYFFNPLRMNRSVTGPATGSQLLFQEDQKGFKFTVGRTF